MASTVEAIMEVMALGMSVPLRLGFREGNVRREVLGEDVGGGAAVGALDLDLHVEPAGAQDGRVDEVLAVGGADDDDVLQTFDAVDLGQELGHDGGLDVGGDAGAAGAEQSVHLVEEDDDGHVLGGLFFGLDENLSNLSLGFSHVLVQQLRSFDVEEEALDLLAALLGDLFGEVVGDGLGDHGLAAAGGAVEEHALGRGELVLLVVVAVEVRELDGVLDGLDLIAEAADVLVADIGHFLEREVFDFALGKLLEQVAALRVEQEVIAGLEAQGAQGLGDDADLLFVGAQGDEGALGVELLLEDDDLGLDLVAGGLDDVEALVEDELLAGLQVFGLDRGMEVDLHLAALGEDRDGVVLVGGEIHAVGRGRGAELVDLFLERGDLLARLVERVDELLVLIERLNELTVRLTQLVLEGRGVVPVEVWVERGGSPFHGYYLRSLRCTHAHQGRFVSALASPTELHASRSTLAFASSAPSHVGRCSSHQHTVRISRRGSRSGLQPGQYDEARLGVSTSSLLMAASAPGRRDRAVSGRRAHERAEREPHRLGAREAVAVQFLRAAALHHQSPATPRVVKAAVE